MKTFELVLFYIENFISLICFLFSLRLWFKPNPPYLKTFLFYPTVSIVFTLVSFYLTFKMPTSSLLIRRIILISVAFHYGILIIVLILVQPIKKYRLAHIYLALIFGIATLYFLRLELGKTPNYSSFFVANLGLILFCIFYFSSLFKFGEISNLKSDSRFWIVTAILLGMGFNLPLYLTMDFLQQNLSLEYLISANSFLSIGFCIMYIVFIKSIHVEIAKRKQKNAVL